MGSFAKGRSSPAILLGSLIVLLASSAFAEDAVGKNRPPRFTGSEPHNYLRLEPTKVRWGKEIRFVLNASDPDGDELQYKVEDLPEGARFSADIREFVWTPSKRDLGLHDLKLTVTDGRASEVRSLRFEVIENRAPVIGMNKVYQLTSGESFDLRLDARDEDEDPITFAMNNLPEGSTFQPQSPAQFVWEPSDSQTGTHVVTVSASDGMASATKDLTLKVKDEWESKLLPGVYYSMYRPSDRTTYGTFQGVSLELVPLAWIRRNDNRGPSHGRLTLKADVLDSTKTGVPALLFYSVGLDLSIERNPSRRWLIPIFGVDLGGIVQKQIGHHFQAMPHLGVYAWASRNIFVSILAGYAITVSQLEALRG
jgi:hypothetical protein